VSGLTLVSGPKDEAKAMEKPADRPTSTSWRGCLGGVVWPSDVEGEGDLRTEARVGGLAGGLKAATDGGVSGLTLVSDPKDEIAGITGDGTLGGESII
jgi:hypothetical protein